LYVDKGVEKIKQRKKKKGRDAQQSDVAMMGGKREREKKEVGMDRR
jgi:hypothetical protein